MHPFAPYRPGGNPLWSPGCGSLDWTVGPSSWSEAGCVQENHCACHIFILADDGRENRWCTGREINPCTNFVNNVIQIMFNIGLKPMIESNRILLSYLFSILCQVEALQKEMCVRKIYWEQQRQREEDILIDLDSALFQHLFRVTDSNSQVLGRLLILLMKSIFVLSQQLEINSTKAFQYVDIKNRAKYIYIFDSVKIKVT